MQFSYTTLMLFSRENNRITDFSHEYYGKFPGLHTDHSTHVCPFSITTVPLLSPRGHTSFHLLVWKDQLYGITGKKHAIVPPIWHVCIHGPSGHRYFLLFPWTPWPGRGDVQRWEKHISWVHLLYPTFWISLWQKCHLLHRQVCGRKDHPGKSSSKAQPRTCQTSPVLVP